MYKSLISIHSVLFKIVWICWNHYFFRWFRISGYYNDIMYVYNKYLISMWATHVEKNHLLLSKYLNHLVCLTFHIYHLLLKWMNSEEVWLDYCDSHLDSEFEFKFASWQDISAEQQGAAALQKSIIQHCQLPFVHSHSKRVQTKSRMG